MNSRDDLAEKLSKESFELLEKFTKSCSKSNATLQGLDATRWNNFIISCHINAEEIPTGILQVYLEERNFDHDVIGHIDALALLEPQLLKDYNKQVS